MVCDIENKINDIVSYSKVSYNAELKKTRINEINVERVKHKKLLDELMNDYKYECISESDYYDFKEKYMYELNKLNLEEENIKNDGANKSVIN